MGEINNKGPLFDPGLCRCCGSLKKCRVLTAPYKSTDRKEIYSDMFFDCFGLTLSNLDGVDERKLICATCVQRLRDAYEFRKQVLELEHIFLASQKSFYNDQNDVDIKMQYLDDSILGPELLNDSWKIEGKSDKPNDNIIDTKIVEFQTETKTKRTKYVHETDEVSTAKCSKTTMINDNASVKLKNTSDKLKMKRMARSNTIKIINNSYVCPFGSSFSDYYCVYCSKDFTDPDILRKHTEEHDTTEYKENIPTRKPLQIDIFRIDCRLCCESINDITSLKNHLVSSHDIKIYDVADEFVCFKLTADLKCIECGTDFSFFHALRNHMAAHFGSLMCDLCGVYYFDERALNLHLKTHQNTTKESFACVECGKTFGTKHSRYLHEARTHKKEPTYACPKCEQRFFSYLKRYRHLIEVHGQKRVFKCTHCERSYDSRKSLREHDRRFHLRIRRHECDLCHDRFYLPSTLKEHMMAHSGERNFGCEYCGKSFLRMKSLKVHLQTHNEVKKFKCASCDASFAQNVSLKSHIKRHHQDLEDFVVVESIG